MSIVPDKIGFFSAESTDIFLISPRKLMLWVLICSACRGTSNEYPQHTFSWRNKNIIWTPNQSCAVHGSHLSQY